VKDLPDIVIGSGPSGVAVAEALLAAGRRVTLIDAGGMLAPDRIAAKQKLAASDPASWTPADLAFLKAPPMRPGEVPEKSSFGSTYPYDPPVGATAHETHGAGIKSSYAVGGLSSVWGSALLPFRAADMMGWPITPLDLRDGYAAAARSMPLSARVDDLAADFPLHRDPGPALPRSRQARILLDRMAAHRDRLRSEGIGFGQSRLAVDAPGCVRCGLCLAGCPRDLIHSTRGTLDRLRAAGLTYESGLVAKRLTEGSDTVEVQTIRPDRSARVLQGRRVFVAAGVLNTTEIMLRSMGWRDRPVSIKDSQYLLLPILQWRGVDAVRREPLHTMAQAFIELNDPEVSANTVHMQAYGYNSLIDAMVTGKLGRLARLLPIDAILGRLMVLQSYLHSNESGTIEVALTGSADNERFALTGRPNPAVAGTVARLTAKLGRLRPELGFTPIRPLVEITAPGRGFHAGGSFPMAHQPRSGETDLLGRPHGFARVHVVDASIFPTIPATTITLAVMANAYRIGAAVAAAGLP
jgi:choline dehydrogenase-like flavoprotein